MNFRECDGQGSWPHLQNSIHQGALAQSYTQSDSISVRLFVELVTYFDKLLFFLMTYHFFLYLYNIHMLFLI